MITGWNVLNRYGESYRKEARCDWTPIRDVQHEALVLTGFSRSRLAEIYRGKFNASATAMARRLDERWIIHHHRPWLRIDREWMGEMVMAQAFGVPFRPVRAEELSRLYAKRLEERQAKYPFKLGSKLAWEGHLGIPLPRSEKGTPLANKLNKDEVLALHPEFEEMYKHRQESLIQTYYCQNKQYLKSNMYKYVGHSKYRQGAHLFGTATYFGTRTGRLQYQSPAYTNIAKGPARSAIGYRGDSKWKVLGLDASGLEYNLLGVAMKAIAKDSSIWNETRRGACPKAKTAKVFGDLLANIPEEDHLKVCKTINYATIYGMGIRSMLNLLKLDDEDEEDVRRALDERFPSLKEVEAKLAGAVDKGSRMFNYFGTPVSAWSEKGARDVPLNTYIQSSGSYYCKSLFRAFLVALRNRCPEARLFLQVHDEIQVSVPRTLGADVVEAAIASAYDSLKHPVIAKLEWSFGNTWEDTH